MEIALAFFLSLLFHCKLARAIFRKCENISLLTKNLPHLQIESSFCVRVALKVRGNIVFIIVFIVNVAPYGLLKFLEPPFCRTRNSRMKANIQKAADVSLPTNKCKVTVLT